ncbi:hypothetical protein L873DRAFT_350256 [Choiromyces venosus 120613-1]|uniref:Uncharacterized protein n=1 Tax=Choiromyces venosus 120613-1 TaxID=1336337 RepID=A0A3N4J3D0_9PEZI|nr:hypothetical protein L873DRAFT_350256 [Choiromyces venosus 120613-1]
MDATTNTSASEPQSSKLNEASTLGMPSTEQQSPDAITETNSSDGPAAAPVAKSPTRSLTTRLKLNTLSMFSKGKGKDKTAGKEKEKENTASTSPAEDVAVAQGDAQEEPGAAKKSGWLKKSPVGKVARKVMGMLHN